MSARLVPLGLVAILGLYLPPGGACDDAPRMTAPVDSHPGTVLSVSAGGAWTAAHVLGGVHDGGRDAAILEAELIRTFGHGEIVAFDWRVGVVPLELQKTRPAPGDSAPGLGSPFDLATVYGAGLDPVGFGVRWRQGQWRPFAAARGGFRWFQSPLPDPRGSRFNFAATLSLGVLRSIGRARWISLSVDFHHVSNGGLADFNPGMNQFVLSIGWQRMR